MSYKDKGNKGEKLAEKFLKRKGYIFIARNYWTDGGELDLVFYKNFSLIVVEDKTRKKSQYGSGREAVDFHKQKCIKSSTKIFLQSHCKKNFAPFYLCNIKIPLKFYKIRYDVIEVSVDEDTDTYTINNHLKGYFK